MGIENGMWADSDVEAQGPSLLWADGWVRQQGRGDGVGTAGEPTGWVDAACVVLLSRGSEGIRELVGWSEVVPVPGTCLDAADGLLFVESTMTAGVGGGGGGGGGARDRTALVAPPCVGCGTR